MSRNNRSRLENTKNNKPETSEESDLVLEEQLAGLEKLSFATPTEIVDLPSQGKHYPEGHPLHDVGQIEIRFMTAKDEDILSSRSLLKNGLALDRLLSNIIVDERIRPRQLLVGDRNALIIASRITGYGPEYKTEAKCPSCETVTEFTYDLGDSTLQLIDEQSLEEEGIEVVGCNQFQITLPVLKLPVVIRILSGEDELELASRSRAREKSKKEVHNDSVDLMRRMIVSVLGRDTSDIVNRLAQHLTARDAKYIRDAYAKISCDIDISQPFHCSECEYEKEDMGVPLTAAFFWPGR